MGEWMSKLGINLLCLLITVHLLLEISLTIGFQCIYEGYILALGILIVLPINVHDKPHIWLVELVVKKIVFVCASIGDLVLIFDILK